eukprot:UN11311
MFYHINQIIEIIVKHHKLQTQFIIILYLKNTNR